MINLEKEIREQPAVLAGVAAANLDTIRALVDEIRAADITNVQFAARGTSDHAAIFAQYLIHTVVGVPCGLATPSVISNITESLPLKKHWLSGSLSLARRRTRLRLSSARTRQGP